MLEILFVFCFFAGIKISEGMIYLSLIVTSILNGLAQITLKLGLSNFGDIGGFGEKCLFLLKSGYFWGGVALYGLSTLIRFYVLSKFEVSYAYPFVAISYIVVLIGGYFLGENITIFRVLGVFLILLGIVFIAKS